MKQKKLGNILYVFDVMPYEITQDTDAEIIKVQEESYKGFVEMNQDLATKIVRYNYHVICVNTPEWAPYVDQEDPQEQLTFGIYGNGAENAINQIQVQNADNVILQSWVAGVDLEFPFQCNVEEGQHCVIECKDNVNILQGFDVTGIEYLPVHWIDQETGHHWYATSPITDSISIGINAASPAEITVTAPYGLEIYDEEHSTWVDVYQDGENPELEHGNLVVGRYYSVDKRGIGQGKVVVFNPECGTGSQGTVGAEFITPETDLTITLADAPSSTYKFVLEGSNIHQNVTVKVNGETTSYTPEQLVDGVQLNDGDVIDVYPTEDVANYTLISGATWDTDHWTATVNAADVDIWINYTAPVSTYTVTLDGGGVHQAVTVKMNGETVPVDLHYQNVADGTVVDVYPTGNIADYALQSGAVWDTDHWTATVNGADLQITIDYYGAGVNFVASWGGGSATPENVSEVVVCGHPVTGNDLTDPNWTETVYTHQSDRFVQYSVSTGLPTDMEKFEVDFEYGNDEHEYHFAYKQTDPDTGEVFYSDASDLSGTTVTNPGTWQYNNTTDPGVLPWIGFEFPSTDKNGNAWADNTNMRIISVVSGS